MRNSWRWPPCNLQDALGTSLLRGKQAAFHSQLQAISTGFQWGASCSWSYLFQTCVLVNCDGCLSVLIYVMWFFLMSCDLKIEFSAPAVCFSCVHQEWVLHRKQDILTKCGTGLFLKGTYEGYIYSVLAFLLQLVCIVYTWCVVVDL